MEGRGASSRGGGISGGPIGVLVATIEGILFYQFVTQVWLPPERVWIHRHP
jgi:hypothetical protein